MRQTYREKIPMYPIFEYLIFLLVAILIISPSYVSIHFRRADSSLILSAIAFVLLLFLYVSFRELEIEATPERLEFGFKLFKKNFRTENIVLCEETVIKFSNYLGWGIRFGRDGSIAYNTRLGKGVKVIVKGLKRPYVFNCSDPKTLCQVIGKEKLDSSESEIS